MRTNLSFWLAPLAMSLVVVASGSCFGQSAVSSPTKDAAHAVPNGNSSELVAEAALSDSAGAPDFRTEAASMDTSDLAISEAAEPAPKRPGQTTSSKIGIGVKVSTLGAGIEVATPLARKFNIRGGFNMFRYDRGITNNGIQYGGQLQFQSVEAHLDFFPIGGFHISPGLLVYNGNQVTATAMVPGGQTFTLGGTTYQSEVADPVTGTGKLDFVKVSPSIMVGIGNLIPRNGRHYSFLFEVGGAYQGSARVALNLTGTVCDPTTGLSCRTIASDPTVQANVAAQQQKIAKDINPYRFYPIISLGVGFNF
jgi:hypothetical protein